MSLRVPQIGSASGIAVITSAETTEYVQVERHGEEGVIELNDVPANGFCLVQF